MRRFYSVYQFVAPLVLLPLCWYLWQREFDGSVRFVLLILTVPIITYYVVPGIGTNYYKLWEINTRLRLGRFRPHHGFVLGGGMAFLTLLCLDRQADGIGVLDVVQAGLVVGSMQAFWNWLYDTFGIESGFLKVYNKAWADGASPAAIAVEYAPAYFGTLGLVHGVGVRVAEELLLNQGRWALYPWIFVGFLVVSIVLPVLAFIGFNYLRTGDAGLRPYPRPTADGPAPPEDRS